ncbi:hypothetical protein MNBD_GAMMA10-1161, partial [hydrothermal vent metagenome]
MYIPEYFKEDDSEKITALVRNNPFGTLISVKNYIPLISHLPLLYATSHGTHRKITGHMSKENEHWEQLITGEPVTAIFSGPHGYISPSYYSSPGVPTWNYAVVHFQGRPIIKNEPDEIIDILRQATNCFESKETGSWGFNIPENKKNLLLNMIGGFEIDIHKIESKFKLSQNRPDIDQQN